MNTQSTKKTSGLKAGLKTLLVVGGALLIPFYAIYFNTGVAFVINEEIFKKYNDIFSEKLLSINDVKSFHAQNNKESGTPKILIISFLICLILILIIFRKKIVRIFHK